jgi:hypothetical protein
MVAALDHVDGVDLHIAEMGDRVSDGLRALAERCAGVEPLGAQPDLAGLCRRYQEGFWYAGHCEGQCSGIRANQNKNERKNWAKKSRAAIC